MKKMQEKSKVYNIQGKITNSHSNQAIWMTKTNPPPRKSANREKSRGLIKNIDQLPLGVYVSYFNIPLLYMISQKVVSPLNMSHLFVED
jgi:hypothetical protein